MNEDWSLTGFVFYDDLSFSGRNEQRPLDVKFVTGVPLALPADAEFANLQGSAHDIGIGIGVNRSVQAGFLDGWRWVAGAVWQRLELENFATPYLLLSGNSAGASGVVGYSATYDFVTPYAGLSRPLSFGHWAIEPRVLAVMPLPRQGVHGRIAGPGFDLSGDTAEAGQGKHYGDPWLVLGMAVRYVPWHLDVDVGSVVSQALLEPVVHTGIDRNLALSFSWQF